MQDNDVQPRGLTRRRVLGGMGIANLALMSSRASAQQTVDLHVPGGPSTRTITTSYPQKGRMILQRSSPPWLETPFEVFDKSVFTPNDQHYVSWHWANFSGRHRCRQLSSDGARPSQSDPFAVAQGYFAGLAENRYRRCQPMRRRFAHLRRSTRCRRSMGKWFNEQRDLDRCASQGRA